MAALLVGQRRILAQAAWSRGRDVGGLAGVDRLGRVSVQPASRLAALGGGAPVTSPLGQDINGTLGGIVFHGRLVLLRKSLSAI